MAKIYRGEPIDSIQYDILIELEQEIGDFDITIEKCQVTALKIIHKGINEIPDSIGKLFSLKWLDLNNNQLSTIPESIGDLSLLESLDLRCNKLVSLPKSIGNLKSLLYLGLNHNQLTSIPENIGELISLNVLDITDNNLSSLPLTIGDLFLDKLILKKNKFPHIDEMPEVKDMFKKMQYKGVRITGIPFTSNLNNFKNFRL